MSSTIQIRVDDDLKQKSDVLFRELGTDTTSAVRIFLTQAVAHNGFPFEIRKTSANPFAAMSEEEIMQKLERSRAHASQGMIRDADEVISDIRTKIKKNALQVKELCYYKDEQEVLSMSQVLVNFRMDAEDKKGMEEVCRELGMSMSTAFTIFAKKMGREKRIPFEVSVDPFYSESNISHLNKITSEIDSGTAHLVEHNLLEGE